MENCIPAFSLIINSLASSSFKGLKGFFQTISFSHYQQYN
ncbi:hypothetical protein HMPREF1863_01095 [Aedoeadaptatus coxii]|uniref:Uncharacterized protein n=1 Tax=Aedoeadaptatus coxii TaxID=755172 RepID=A0A134AFB8_9FIRM|nr:hypothetical protein HMPREF1863_01095 [Peptoniphilus coxii]